MSLRLKAASTMIWPRLAQTRARQVLLWAGGCLALTALLIYPRVSARLATNKSSGFYDLFKEPALLDSFSEPAVACALLKQESLRLLLVYEEKQIQQRASPSPGGTGRSELSLPSDDPHRTIAPDRAEQPSALEIPETQSLLALDARVWDLHLDLSRKTLRVYLDQHSWDKFVDRYLEILRASPEWGEVRAYLARALDCADKCGRTTEVIGALQQATQAHPELLGFAGLREAVADRKAAHPPGAEVAPYKSELPHPGCYQGADSRTGR
jgi:hypothetical protein